MQESGVDKSIRRGQRLNDVLFWSYVAVTVYVLVKQPIVGMLLVPLGARLFARRLLDWMFEHVPALWRRLAYAGWHGSYREFDNLRVRVVDGTPTTDTLVYAQDVFFILGQFPNARELDKLKIKWAPDLFVVEEGTHRGQLVFTDQACIEYVKSVAAADNYRDRTQVPNRLLLWLEREVFRTIDNQRTMRNGRTYPFTSETRFQATNKAPAAFHHQVKPPVR